MRVFLAPDSLQLSITLRILTSNNLCASKAENAISIQYSIMASNDEKRIPNDFAFDKQVKK
jgi:hypothetical protein